MRDTHYDIYEQWPLRTPPPPRNQVEWLGSGPDTYTFVVDGQVFWGQDARPMLRSHLEGDAVPVAARS